MIHIIKFLLKCICTLLVLLMGWILMLVAFILWNGWFIDVVNDMFNCIWKENKIN